MQPGPVTATAISMGAHNRWAGALMAIGHGLLELPLVILIMLGLDKILNSEPAQITIGLAGGTVLLWMGTQMMKTAKEQTDETRTGKTGPLVAGFVLSASNPYFLLWWASVGLALATRAREFGAWAFAIFAVVHWLVDFVWVTSLSFASYYGTALLGKKAQQTVMKICGALMALFGIIFIHGAISTLMS